MTSPIIDFIEARLAEDEQIARNASMPWVGGDREVWTYDRDAFAVRATHGRWSVATRRDDPPDSDPISMTDSYGEHIVRFQPARVLREVAAKRALLADFTDELRDAERMEDVDMIEAYTRLLGVLAAPYSDHPDFDPNWSTT